jgi:mannose-6-phosphate isomerase
MLSDSSTLGPMKLRASLHETIWGGHRLSDLAGKDLPEDRLIGEAWETAIDSQIIEGSHAGKPLGSVVEEYGARFLGWRVESIYGARFPLLAKFIDAQQWLSVQVHPDDTYAALHEGGKLGKTECWYILDATPGAKIIYGVKNSVNRDAVRAAIQQTQLEELLLSVVVEPGDVIFVPAGAVHAIGAGVALYELQEYSDITYRLYDYGRLQANGQPRELHVDQALDVMRYDPSPTIKAVACVMSTDDLCERRVLVACDYFIEEELRIKERFSGSVTEASLQILTVLEGSCELRVAEASYMRLGLGDTVVLPAGLGEYTLEGGSRLIRAYVPEASDEALARWRAVQDGGDFNR